MSTRTQIQQHINNLLSQLQNYVTNLSNLGIQPSRVPDLYQLYCLLKILSELRAKGCNIEVTTTQAPNSLVLPLNPWPVTTRGERTLDDSINKYRRQYSLIKVNYVEPSTGINIHFEIYYNLCVPYRLKSSYRSLLCQAPDIIVIYDQNIVVVKDAKYSATGSISLAKLIRTILGYYNTLVNREKANFVSKIINEFSAIITNINITATAYWRDNRVKEFLLGNNIKIISEPV